MSIEGVIHDIISKEILYMFVIKSISKQLFSGKGYVFDYPDFYVIFHIGK